MRKTMVWTLCALFSTVALAQSPVRRAPGNMPGDFMFIPKADLEVLMGPTRGDRASRVVPIGEGAQMGAFILPYEKMKNDVPDSFYHGEIHEIYYVIRGEGTALLGGELENARWDDSTTQTYKSITGPTARGRMKGYTMQKWSAGDVIIVPAGVPHTIGWEVTVPNDILRVVMDPKSRLNRITTREQSIAQANPPAQQAQAPAAPAQPAPPNMPGTATFIPKADLQALMKGAIGDTPARVVPVANRANLGVFVLHMEPRKATGPVNSFYHSEIAELYYIARGSGAALLGGELENATWDDSNSASIKNVRGPSVNG